MTTPSSVSSERSRDKRLRDQYNISAVDYEKILRHQGRLCALCREANARTGKNKGLPKKLFVDHDHKTGLTRGILCYSCNRRIPEWMTVEWLKKVLAYLESPPCTVALGEERYGRKGRVTNKRPRRATKRRKK